MNYKRRAFFNRSDFPDAWERADYEFLAEFCRDEFGAELVETLNDSEGYDYHLYVNAEVYDDG